MTWNVLHRIHADNWGEAVVHADEAARIAAITARLVARDEQVLALQEVSGDQLASLRTALPTATIFTLQYPRIPKPRHGTSSLRDPAEYLVTVVLGAATEVAAEASRDDPGKGLLAVDVGGALVINTHVTYGEPRVRQLARLSQVACATDGPAILLGDFNAERTIVAAALGEAFAFAVLAESALPTRPRTTGGKSSSIDHVIVRGATAGAAAVIDAGGLSDHSLVTARIES